MKKDLKTKNTSEEKNFLKDNNSLKQAQIEHQIEMDETKEVIINHPMKIVSFAHIDLDKKDLYTYYFMFEMGKMKLHSIDVWRKNGKSGNTYKHEEIFHCEYRKTITNYQTAEFEDPKIPVDVWRNAYNCLRGYLLNNI